MMENYMVQLSKILSYLRFWMGFILASFSISLFSASPALAQAAAPFPNGAGLGSSVCGASAATNPYQDIGLRWEYNDWGGWNPNASIDQTNIIASATPATFNNMSGQVNSFDLNLNADQIPSAYDSNTYFEYQFTTANFSDKAEFTGAGFTLFEKTDPAHFQATGAYRVAILIDDDPAFGSPEVWFSDLAFDNGDVSGASASTVPNNTGNYVQTFAHFDPNGASVELSPNTSYKMRIFPFDVTEFGDDNGQPFTNIVMWDDFMPKIVSCSNPVAPVDDMASTTAGTASIPITNVASNDTIDGQPADLTALSGNGSVSQVGVWPAGFSLSSLGAVNMQSTVSSGVYNMDYELCDLNVPANCSTASIEITVEAPAAPPAFPDGPGLGASICNVDPPTQPYADIGFRWLYNDNGGTSPNGSIDNNTIIASVSPASFSGVSAQVNGYDLNLNADQIPDSFNSSVYLEYQFTTQNFADKAELIGAGWTIFEHQNNSDQQATGAYRVAILVDDDPAFSSPDVWYSDLQFDGVDVSAASASTAPNYTGTYLQSFAHWDPDGTTVELLPSTSYKMRVYPYNVTEFGDDNGQPFANVVLWDDFTPKVKACVDMSAAPAMSLTKMADKLTDLAVGEIITYSYVVENTGDVNIDNITIDDQHTSAAGTATLMVAGETGQAGNSADSSDATSNDGIWDVLAPGDQVSFTASYEVTYDDLVAGADITNSATATGSPVSGTLTDPVATASVSVAEAAPQLVMTKEADNTSRTEGDIITYTYTVTNNGNVAVQDVTITDTHNGSDPAPTPLGETLLTDVAPIGDTLDTVANDGNWVLLGPGDTITLTGSYTVTAADVSSLSGTP